MFQKCPKCNGEGTIQKVEINMEWKPGMNNGPAFYYANVSCPLCLGEFVIHEEQGVPPSKVKPPQFVGNTYGHPPFVEDPNYVIYREEQRKKRVEAESKPACGCPYVCYEYSNCDHSKPKAI